MKILELFAGSRSIGKVAERMGHDVFSSDIEQFQGINYCVDIAEFEINELPWMPDMIWASPPCTGFSVAAIGKNWGGGKGAYIPISDTAKLGIKILEHTIALIRALPWCIWWIENPRGVMRKMPIMQNLPRTTITYCQYGDTRMKPTDIWTNCDRWQPRPPCRNGDTCHEAAPRGSRTGTQGIKGAYERSKIPEQLCEEVIIATDEQCK